MHNINSLTLEVMLSVTSLALPWLTGRAKTPVFPDCKRNVFKRKYTD